MHPFAIKLRETGKKRWDFLTSKGGVNSLRIHAARFETAAKAQALVDENKGDNPEWEFKVVDMNSGAEVAP